MRHALDNPIWHALTGPHARFAIGQGGARHYPADISPFSAIEEPTDAAYSDLAADLPPGSEARLFRTDNEPAPEGWETSSARPIIQMVCDRIVPLNRDIHGEPEALSALDSAIMLDLIGAAKPGPFARNTVLLGDYAGYREGGRLLAMGGARFRLPGFVELSAISVQPDARGRGYGAAIVSSLVRRAMERGETPFLHAFPDNPAVSLYRQLGFKERRGMWVICRRIGRASASRLSWAPSTSV